MPPIEAFRDVESYYATLAHEEIHNADRRIMPIRVGMRRRSQRFRRILRGIIRAIIKPRS
jgi:antirestriction protein ArdC